MTRKPVDNSELLREIKQLRAEMNRKFEEIKPYIDTLANIKGAGKIATWVVGVVMAVGGLYLMYKQVFPVR